VLTHVSRQLQAWLIFNVRQNEAIDDIFCAVLGVGVHRFWLR
jgi:hypothetical protein